VDNQTPVIEPWTGSLAYNDSATYTFTATFASPATNYQVCAFTQLATDGFTGNDKTCLNLQSLPAPYDAKVVDILHPLDTVCRDQYPKPVIIRMTNLGTQPITAMDVQYKINTTTPIVESWTGTLNPDDTATYTFNQLFTAPIGVFIIRSETNLANDADPGNDEASNTVISVSCVGIEDGAIDGFALGQNIPNPARDITRIGYDIPQGGKVRFSVTNLLGQEIFTDGGNRMAGHHVIDLNISGYPAGTYYYTLEYEGARLSRKMVIVK